MAERAAASHLAASRSTIVTTDTGGRARLGPRILSFLIDSLVLLAFTLIFGTLAMLTIFLSTNSGRSNLSHTAAWTAVAIVVATAPAWLLLNLVLTVRRGQTVGQYVVGLRIIRDDGQPLRPGRLLLYLLSLHPVLFHPLLAVSWGLVAYLALAFSGSPVLLSGALVVVVLSVIAPLIALLAIALDGGRRGLHDRAAGLTVTRIE